MFVLFFLTIWLAVPITVHWSLGGVAVPYIDIRHVPVNRPVDLFHKAVHPMFFLTKLTQFLQKFKRNSKFLRAWHTFFLKIERSDTKLSHFFAPCTPNAPILASSTPNANNLVGYTDYCALVPGGGGGRGSPIY